MRGRSVGTVALAVLLLGFGGIASASDLYTLTATTTSGPPQTVTTSGATVLGLVQDAVNAKGQFQSLQGRDVSMTLTSAGNKEVFTITRNAAGTSGTLTIPSTGYTKTFTAANADALRQSFTDFLKGNVDGAVARLNEKLQQFTKVGLIDGNPHAVTAIMADDAFYRFALQRTTPKAGAGGWVYVDGGTYHAAGIDSDYGTLGFGFDVPFGERAAASIGFTSAYNHVGGANSYTFAGLDIGLPLTIAKTPSLDGFVWKVTPFGYGTMSISPDTLSGGTVYGGGGASSLSYIAGPWTFTLGDQISYFGGSNLGLGGRVYGNRNLDQWITKNGLGVAYMPGQHLFLDTGVTYTHFIKSAGVPDYVSPTVGIGWRFNAATQLRVGARGDFVNGYTSVGGEVSLNASY